MLVGFEGGGFAGEVAEPDFEFGVAGDLLGEFVFQIGLFLLQDLNLGKESFQFVDSALLGLHFSLLDADQVVELAVLCLDEFDLALEVVDLVLVVLVSLDFLFLFVEALLIPADFLHFALEDAVDAEYLLVGVLQLSGELFGVVDEVGIDQVLLLEFSGLGAPTLQLPDFVVELSLEILVLCLPEGHFVHLDGHFVDLLGGPLVLVLVLLQLDIQPFDLVLHGPHAFLPAARLLLQVAHLHQPLLQFLDFLLQHHQFPVLVVVLVLVEADFVLEAVLFVLEAHGLLLDFATDLRPALVLVLEADILDFFEVGLAGRQVLALQRFYFGLQLQSPRLLLVLEGLVVDFEFLEFASLGGHEPLHFVLLVLDLLHPQPEWGHLYLYSSLSLCSSLTRTANCAACCS